MWDFEPQKRSNYVGLDTLAKDPAKDFIPAIHWIYKLLISDSIDHLKLDGYAPVLNESESDFLFRILKNSPTVFMNAIKKMENEERSKGKAYYMFSLNEGERLPANIRFLTGLEEVEKVFKQRFFDVGYGRCVTVSEFLTDEIVGLNIVRGGNKTNAPKIDISDVARPVTQRDVRADLAFYHIPSRSILVSTRYPTDVIFYVEELQKLLFGASGKFSQRAFSSSFIKNTNIEDDLARSGIGLAEKLRLREVIFNKTGPQPKTERHHTPRRPAECLSHPSYEDFHQARHKFTKAKSVKIQIEMIGEKRFYDSIVINENRVEFGKHISEEITLAILYKLNVITRYSDA